MSLSKFTISVNGAINYSLEGEQESWARHKTSETEVRARLFLPDQVPVGRAELELYLSTKKHNGPIPAVVKQYDALVNDMEHNLEKVCKGTTKVSSIRHEETFLAEVARFHSFKEKIIRDKTKLMTVFGNCVRLARLNAIVVCYSHASKNSLFAGDGRLEGLFNDIKSIESILIDAGYAKRLGAAMHVHTRAMQHRFGGETGGVDDRVNLTLAEESASPDFECLDYGENSATFSTDDEPGMLTSSNVLTFDFLDDDIHDMAIQYDFSCSSADRQKELAALKRREEAVEWREQCVAIREDIVARAEKRMAENADALCSCCKRQRVCVAEL